MFFCMKQKQSFCKGGSQVAVLQWETFRDFKLRFSFWQLDLTASSLDQLERSNAVFHRTAVSNLLDQINNKVNKTSVKKPSALPLHKQYTYTTECSSQKHCHISSAYQKGITTIAQLQVTSLPWGPNGEDINGESGMLIKTRWQIHRWHLKR